MNRRSFIASSAAVLATSAQAAAVNGSPAGEPRTDAPSIIHTTDLYRPHDDPDDHWDLACLYALMAAGDLDIRAVAIDFPRSDRRGDPDLVAVGQMNYMAHTSVPVLIGPSRSSGQAFTAANASAQDLAAPRELVRILERSPTRVLVHIGGSAETVALALAIAPKTFAAKCSGIYLNAGFGEAATPAGNPLEANVAVNPAAYAAIFDSPCPVYWMPCFDHGGPFRMSEWGTFFRFRQGDVLPHVSQQLQNYFSLVARDGVTEPDVTAPRTISPNWMRYLLGPNDEPIAAKLRASGRNMWCTPAMLHAAGLNVTGDGEIKKQTEVPQPLFEVVPIKVRCSPDGRTEWSRDPHATSRFIFHVRDQAAYGTAMSTALKSLLIGLVP